MILYIGLTRCLRRRFEEHLDNPVKRAITAEGRATVFHWREYDDLEPLERSWMNSFMARNGKLPALNRGGYASGPL